jgi:polyphosphate kinase
VDLIIRGMCTLKPGVPGLSENIRVRSILGRFLEHSRVFRFGNNDEAEFWIGSADMMHRNLDARVEAMIQVTDPVAREALDRVISEAMSDEREAFELGPDGSWIRRVSSPDNPLTDLQQTLLQRVGAN